MSLRFVGGRILGSISTLVFVVIVNFFLFRILNDDPVSSLYRGSRVPQSKLDELRSQFGLDEPLVTQFALYVRETARLNFGLSYQTRQPVWDEIQSKIWPTVLLVGVAAILSAVIGVAAGFIAAWRRGSKTDYSITSSTMLFYSMPDFWLGMLLLLGFAVALPWFPVGGMYTLGSSATGVEAWIDLIRHLTLPALTLTLAYLGEYAIVARSSMLEVMNEDYLMVARAKGLRDVLIRRRHAARNALLPIVTLAAINLGFVLSGAIAVETVFGWPGLGRATADAIRGPDLPMLQGLFLVFSAAVIAFNLLADLLYALLDPRVRAS
jgi:peptide/nickel transport system permease protein